MNVNGVTFTIKAIDSASSVLGKVGNSITGLKGIAFSAVGSMKNMFTGLGNHIAMAMGIGTAGITATLAMLSKSAVGLASNFEQARIAFTGMLGSKDAAQSLLNTLQQFANVTPFEFPQLIQATRLLTSYGFKVNELLPTLTAVGDAVSGLGGGADVLQRVMLAIGQIKSKGFLSGEEARQMAESGINAYQMVAEALGVSIPQAMQMSEKKIVNADMALAAIVSGMEKRFPGMMAMQSQTLQGVASTLRDVFNTGLRKIGEVAASKLTSIAKGLINVFTVVFTDANINKFSKWLDNVFSRDNIQKIATWFVNIYVWSRDVFSKMGELGSKSINWITKALHNMHDFIAKNLIPMLFKMTSILIHIKSIELGVNVASAMAKIAANIPDPRVAGIVLASAVPAGLAAATGVDIAGQTALAATEFAYVKFKQGLKQLNIPEFPNFGQGAINGDVESIVSSFMAGFDQTMNPMQSAALQTATNTGMLVQQNKSLMSSMFGNGGDRMRALETRARFGNLNTRGGGVQVNITVSSQKDADNLRYALQLAAAR